MSLRLPSWLQLLLCVVALTLPQYALALDPPTSVSVASINSTAMSFSVGLPASATSDERLRVLVQKAVDGNATNAYLDIELPGPMTVNVSGLTSNAGYVFYFYLESASNSSSSDAVSPSPALQTTYAVAPSIIAFYASGGSSSSSDDSFSSGDTVIIAFDADTNQPSVGSKADVDALFSFSVPFGDDYSGTWQSASVLQLTINDVGQSSPTIGQASVTVIGGLYTANGLSEVSRSTSPPLIGSWAAITTSDFSYFVPIDSKGNELDPTQWSSYGVTADMNEARSIPLKLQFPSGSKTVGYGITALLTYPTDASLYNGFELSGQNFTAASQIVQEAPLSTSAADQFTNSELVTLLQGLSLTPMTDYVGYAAVEVQLWDRSTSSSGTQIASSFITISFEDPNSAVYNPTLTSNGPQSSSSSAMDQITSNKTIIIAVLCSVFGAVLLGFLGWYGCQRWKGSRDARDFEGQHLTEHDPAAYRDSDGLAGDGGATRRFYYDAKV